MLSCPFDDSAHDSLLALVKHWGRCIKGRGRSLFFCPKSPLSFFADERKRAAHAVVCGCSARPGWKPFSAVTLSSTALIGLQRELEAEADPERHQSKGESRPSTALEVSAALTVAETRPEPTLKLRALFEGRELSIAAVALDHPPWELDGLLFEPETGPCAEIWALHLHRAGGLRQSLYELLIAPEQIVEPLLAWPFKAVVDSTVFLLLHIKLQDLGPRLARLVRVGNALLVALPGLEANPAVRAALSCADYLEQQLLRGEERLRAMEAQAAALRSAETVPQPEGLLGLQVEHEQLLQSTAQLAEQQRLREETAALRREACLREIDELVGGMAATLQKAEAQRVLQLREKLQKREGDYKEVKETNLRAERELEGKRAQCAAARARETAAQAVGARLQDEIERLTGRLAQPSQPAPADDTAYFYLCTACRRRFSTCLAVPCMHVLSVCYACLQELGGPEQSCRTCRRRIYAVLSVFNPALAEIQSDRSEVSS